LQGVNFLVVVSFEKMSRKKVQKTQKRKAGKTGKEETDLGRVLRRKHFFLFSCFLRFLCLFAAHFFNALNCSRNLLSIKCTTTFIKV